jgi:isochorismate synthase EntC
MPVVSYCSYRYPGLQAIHPLIAESLQQVNHQNQPKLVSISLDIPEIDPLLALAELSHNRERHLYLEHSATQDAVAAFGTALFFQATGRDRFNQTRQFIEQWIPKIQSFHGQEGSKKLSDFSSAARFFCSFSFFPRSTGSGMEFPTASAMLPQWQITPPPLNLYSDREPDCSLLDTSLGHRSWTHLDARLSHIQQSSASKPGCPPLRATVLA